MACAAPTCNTSYEAQPACPEPVTCDTGCDAPAQNEVCTPEWDYVRKAKVNYKSEPYQATVTGQKTIMVDQEQPYYKCVQKTKQVPCTVKKLIKVKEPCTKTVMKPFDEPYTTYKTEQIKVPYQRKVCYTQEVPSTRKVQKQVKVPCTNTVMKQFPVQSTRKCQKEILVDSEREVSYQVKVPTTKTIQVPKQVCETKYRTAYKAESYKKPYECRIYNEPCILPAANDCAPVESNCAPCAVEAPAPACDTGCY